MVYKDEGRNAEAVQWLQIAYAEHEKVPSPNLDSMADDLEKEIGTLKALGRADEAALAGQRLQAVRDRMRAVVESSHDLSAVDSRAAQCALLVELDFDSSSADSAQRKSACAELARRFGYLIEDTNVGFFAGSLTIPESTTLIFYGFYAEAIFATLESSLRSEPICSGARITIRQQDGFREVILPTRLN